jgi:hypothetical protein
MPDNPEELLISLYAYLLRSWTQGAEPVTVLLTVENRIGEYVLNQSQVRGVKAA